MAGIIERVLGLAGPGDERAWRDNLRALRIFLFLHLGARTFLTMPAFSELEGWGAALDFAAIGVAIAGVAANATAKLVPFATAIVGIELLARLVIGGETANHVFLEFVVFGFFSLCRVEKEGEAELLLQGLRWTIAIFFFYTGLQKVLYGYYFDGQFLAYMAATSDRFATVFQFVIPAEELARLQAFNGPEVAEGRWEPVVGAGPYRVASPLFVAMSNGVYLFEMAAGIALMLPRLRSAVALLSIAFVFAIEAGAREFVFGALMVNLLLLYVDRPWIRGLLPISGVFYGYLLLAERGGLGWLPMFWYRA